MRLGTSFNSRYSLSVLSHRDTYANRFGVRIMIDLNIDGSNYSTINIYGNDESRVVQSFIHYVNDLSYAFSPTNTNITSKFPTTIETRDELLNHERSYDMSINWSIN